MLFTLFPKLGEVRAVRMMRSFFRSNAYIAVIALLMACAELFSLELAVYWVYLLFGVLIVLFDEDTLAIAPIMCCSYMTVSGRNNVGKHEHTVFSTPAFRNQFLVILALAVAILLIRLVSKLILDHKQGVPSLTLGFAVLGLAYVLGGLLGGSYGGRTAFFGFAQIVSLCAGYFFFYFTVDWKNARKDYVLFLFFCIGIALIAETVGMYFHDWVDLKNLHRSMLYTGWGIYNNVGCALCMCIPAAFYFAATKKNGWFFTFAASLIMLAVVLTQSRTSILFGAVVYCLCAVTVLVKTKGAERVKHIVVFAAMLVAVLVCLIVLREKMLALFKSVLSEGFQSPRHKIYEACWKKFTDSPVFGVGFYETPGGLLNDGEILDLAPCPPDVFLPPRAHNTYLQLLASGGLFAIVAYLYHRGETLVMLFRRPTTEKTFIAFCILALILTSILDCHFFNFGPGILYSVLLVFAEGENRKMPELRRRKKEKAKTL